MSEFRARPAPGSSTFWDTLRRFPIRRGPDRWVGGIAGGIALRFGWEPSTVRIVTLLTFLLPGIGLFTYLVVWLLMPKYDGTIALESIINRLRGRA